MSSPASAMEIVHAAARGAIAAMAMTGMRTVTKDLGLGFETGIAPVLGLRQAKRVRLAERIAFAADHLLYGLVLSEFRRRPQEAAGADRPPAGPGGELR
jgi:hypothetical protein